jgi:hypothetical protein
VEPSEASSTPKLPVITLEDGALLSTSLSQLPQSGQAGTFVVDQAKADELLAKFTQMMLRERELEQELELPHAMIPKLRIPKRAKKPPKPVQRQMAKGSSAPTPT